MRIFDRFRGKTKNRTSNETGATTRLKLKTVADFMKLVGMDVSISTKDGDLWEGTVKDISDSGTHLILCNLERFRDSEDGVRTKNIMINDIDEIGRAHV